MFYATILVYVTIFFLVGVITVVEGARLVARTDTAGWVAVGLGGLVAIVAVVAVWKFIRVFKVATKTRS